ncbi:MAG: hypothetical protein HYV09_01115 [Deltaproteobacteria bacterium]|nr:hypothetical protein [Deltaproteobacteria bacterium]
MKRSPLLLVVLALAAGPVIVTAACGGGEPEPKTATVTKATETVAPAPSPTPSPAATPEPIATTPLPPPPPPVVEDMAPSADPTPLPTVKILAPAEGTTAGDVEKAKNATVRLDVKNWETKEGGNHVHLILDDHPYKPIYDTKAPVKIAELLPAGVDLTEGLHVLHAFPSRPTHESVKSKGALSMVTFWVGKKGKATVDYKKPHVVYSRPKGSYAGPAAKELLLDFYLVGTTLEKGDKVRYTITGPGLDTPLTGEFTKWAPKVVKNLGKGEYSFKLEYLDKDGKVIAAPLNGTTRTVKLDPTAEPGADAHGGHAMPMGAGSAAPGASAAPASSK